MNKLNLNWGIGLKWMYVMSAQDECSSGLWGRVKLAMIIIIIIHGIVQRHYPLSKSAQCAMM